ncbi:MAG: hypothetical protein HYT61_02430 [Candidatus Yanofskybacteria bacterium]|nr:hypothetical protein [Candidatus Yanofskybacteria bacterium]
MEIEKLFSELMKIKQEIFRRKVKNLLMAEHASPFKGAGYEMHSINAWRPGEPMLNIDWSLSMRTWPKIVYKVDRIETKNAPAIILADLSPSVFVGFNEENSKFKLMLHLVGALGLAANYFHDPAGIVAFSSKIEFYLRPKLGQGEIFLAMKMLLEKESEFADAKSKNGPSTYQSGINPILTWLVARFKRQCSIIILSDFTDEVGGRFEIDFKLLEALSAKHNWNVIAIFLDEPNEFSWQNSSGTVLVKDAETGAFEKIKSKNAVNIRRGFVEKREEFRRKLKKSGVDSTILNFGNHFNELAQFLLQRKQIYK